MNKDNGNNRDRYIIHNDIIMNISYEEDESNSTINKRMWFILKNIKEYDCNIHRLISLSYIYVNNILLGCTYDNDIMCEISECESRLFI